MKHITRIFTLFLCIILTGSVALPAFAAETSVAPILSADHISVTEGKGYDLTAKSPSSIYNLNSGTVYISYQSNSNQEYQSLFSVSNSTDGNMYRHFHVYITPEGVLGMELRNTDGIFKYTMVSVPVLSPGQTNKIAFSADQTEKVYKLYANGELVKELPMENYKFLADIPGLCNVSLGKTVRDGKTGYPFGGTIYECKVYDQALGDQQLCEMTANTLKPLIERNDISITEGSFHDLSSDENASVVESLGQGTFVLTYATSSEQPIQSLISVGNSTPQNRNRHFHLYITNSGSLGMELRNTDISFKYTTERPAVVQGKSHGKPAFNTIAFKANPTTNSYKLFANGRLVTELSKNDYKFIKDIAGVNNITLGATIRNGQCAYPFGGVIKHLAIFDYPLSDDKLCDLTSISRAGNAMFYVGDTTGSNYFRIPTLLTLKSGTVVSSIDARYGGSHDAKSNIDIAFSRSLDGGVTWSDPVLPLVFDDYAAQAVEWPRDNVGKNVQISGSAAFIDSVLLQDKVTERLFLFADAFPSGKGFNNASDGTGFKEVNGTKYLKLHKKGDLPNSYQYTIRDDGVIYDDRTDTPTEYSVDGNYRLLKSGEYLKQKQYRISFNGSILSEEKTNIEVNSCVFYKDAEFALLPTNYLVMKYSDDDGVTWSDMEILGDFRDVNQRMILFGPGVGTQIQNGPHAGRLLISAYNSVSGEYGYLCSDDHGANWTFINTDLGGSGNFAEAQIVEFPDGTLQTYMRTNIGKIGYITSIDGGQTWSTTEYIPNVNVASYGTQLSCIVHSQTINGKNVILLSTPTATNGRRGGKILVGLVSDTGVSGYNKYSVNWINQYQIDYPEYGFSYSCMTELPNHDIGLLYEKYDSWSRDELHLKDVMCYETFTLEELTTP